MSVYNDLFSNKDRIFLDMAATNGFLYATISQNVLLAISYHPIWLWRDSDGYTKGMIYHYKDGEWNQYDE